MAAPERDGLLTVREAARRLGVHENTIRNWTKRGLLEPVVLPGSRYQRFRPEDIEKAARDQERSAARALQAEPTGQFVDSDFLDGWAGRRQAEELLPETVQRLLAATRGLVGLRGRAGTGIRAPGWDASVDDSPGTPWVPAGPSGWEIGTGGDPARKAQEDYDARSREPLGVDPAASTFVFVTPRRWPRARAWERERLADGVWRGVRVIDADDLAAWLQSQPATHLWLSERVGLRPLEVRTVAQWWEQFRSQTAPPLPAGVLLAGRSDAAKSLLPDKRGEGSSLVYVQASSREEAAAFIGAALSATDYPRAALMALTEKAWERLAISAEPALLVPYFDQPNLATVTRAGHHILVPIPPGPPPVDAEVIVLPPLDRSAAREAFVKDAGLSFEKADRLAGLARRSFASLLRSPDVAASPRSNPGWAQGPHARMVASLVLAGSWTATEHDQQAVTTIAAADAETVTQELVAWKASGDPPFIQAGGGWQVVSPDGAWGLLHTALLPADLTRFCDQAVQVLAETDPALSLEPDERLLAGVRGIRQKFSPTLREGVAQGLALLGASDVTLPDGSASADFARRAVMALLERANRDTTSLTWASLSRQLPLLAEASPDAFLDAVEEASRGDAALITGMFTDDENASALSTSSPHTGLLWALELLCWSKDHLSRAAAALARLVELDDPPGRLANRPASSLRTVFLPWLPRTEASLDQRLSVLDRLRRHHPVIAWTLELSLLPQHHDSSMNTATPRFRRWSTSEQRVPLAEWLAAVAATVERVIEDAGTDPSRWAQVVESLGNLPDDQRQALLSRLEGLEPGAMDPDERKTLWSAVVELVEHHRSFPDARWALPSEPLDRLEHLAARLSPDDAVARHVRLFDWRPFVRGVAEDDFEAHEAAIAAARRGAVAEVLRNDGMDGIRRLADASKIPEEVGAQLAAVDPDDPTARGGVFAMLGEQTAGGRLAAGWVHAMARRNGDDWMVRTAAELAAWPADTQVAFLLSLGFLRRQVLDLVGASDGRVSDLYWKKVQPGPAVESDAVYDVVDQLLRHDRPWPAIDTLTFACHRHERQQDHAPDVDQVIAVLEAALRTGSADRGRGASLEYEVGQLLDYLEKRGVDSAVLARLEWSYFRMLEYTREARALYDALGQDPKFFVDLVSLVYRAKNAPPPSDRDEDDVAMAQNAWAVLHKWRRPPGTDAQGKIDGDHLRAWVRRARLLLADADRADIGDQQIGQVLAGSGSGQDDIWPAEPVRELIEDLGSRHLETGISVGIHNLRGVTSRDLYAGGAQEWEIARRYRASAAALMDRWPRTGRLLNELATTYEWDARREDAEAQSRANEL
jgi:excisionase family DNA binding protein